MDKKMFEKYARLIVRVGANVQEGQKVRLHADVEQAMLATMVVEECYKAGAARVEMNWMCGPINKLDYTYATAEELGTVQAWEEERTRQMTEDYPVRIFIESSDPDELNGISADKISTVTKMRNHILKKYRNMIDGKHQWLIVAAASPAWAKKVFPGEETEVAVEKLWNAIFDCVYLNKDTDIVEEWKAHTDLMTAKGIWLTEQNFKELRYKSSNGTDFKVELIPGAKFAGAKEFNHIKELYFVPNLPTEEVFTTPMRGRCEGRLVSTKALSWSGQLIDEFVVDFKDGKVCDCHAKVGEDTLKKMFAIDEGSSMLGEVALVPKESPINRSGLMFFNTLFDENACCHVAVGRGFGEVIDGFIDMTEEELYEKGINDSLIHVDFMIGSEDLDITGIRQDGTEVPVFRNGTWAE